jgi:hypothetical protein
MGPELSLRQTRLLSRFCCSGSAVPFFTDRERAALEWTEHLTLLASKGISDEPFERVREHFSEEETIHLTLAVVQINSWNRLAITARAPVGTYQPGQFERATA